MKKSNKYSVEQKQFILAHYKGIGTKELTDLFNERFNADMTVSKMKSYKANNKLNSGLTGRFEKGNVPVNKGKKNEC